MAHSMVHNMAHNTHVGADGLAGTLTGTLKGTLERTLTKTNTTNNPSKERKRSIAKKTALWTVNTLSREERARRKEHERLNKFMFGFETWSRVFLRQPGVISVSPAEMAYGLVGVAIHPTESVYAVTEAISRLLSIEWWFRLIDPFVVSEVIFQNQTKWSKIQSLVLRYSFLRWVNCLCLAHASKHQHQFFGVDDHDAKRVDAAKRADAAKRVDAAKRLMMASTTSTPMFSHCDFPRVEVPNVVRPWKTSWSAMSSTPSIAVQTGDGVSRTAVKTSTTHRQGFTNANNACALEVMIEVLVHLQLELPNDQWVQRLPQSIQGILEQRLRHHPETVQQFYLLLASGFVARQCVTQMRPWTAQQTMDSVLERVCDHSPYSLLQVNPQSWIANVVDGCQVTLTWLFSRLDLTKAFGLTTIREFSPRTIVLDLDGQNTRILPASLTVPFPLVPGHLYRVVAILRRRRFANTVSHFCCYLWSEAARTWRSYDSAAQNGQHVDVRPDTMTLDGISALVVAPMVSLLPTQFENCVFK